MRTPVRDFGLVGFDHLDLRVRDLAKVRRFFVDQLGMEVLGEGEDHCYLLFGGQVLGLHAAGEGKEPSGQVDHIALRVSEWTGLKSRVQRSRVVITGETEREESRSLFLRGPDGIRIELVWRPDPTVPPSTHRAGCAPSPARRS
ncbi:MAG: VOC family protein [Thermoplasmata archaeon]